MQTMYNLQNNLTPEKEHILAFLSAGEDLEVLQELENRKLKDFELNSMEGEITRKELRTQLFQHMKPNSAPSIDGFKVLLLLLLWFFIVKNARDTSKKDYHSRTVVVVKATLS